MEHIMHTRQKNCEFCGRFFIPDCRIGSKQRSCARPDCRTLRKAAAQAAWVSKNSDYFKGRYATTKKWREEHPGINGDGGKRAVRYKTRYLIHPQ